MSVQKGDRVTIHPQNQPLLDHMEGAVGVVEHVYVHSQLVPRVPGTVTVFGPDNVVKSETRVSVRMENGATIECREGDGWYRPEAS